MVSRSLKKSDMQVYIIWLGSRLWGNLDFQTFYLNYQGYGIAPTKILSLDEPFSESENFNEFRDLLLRAKATIDQIINTKIPTAIFLVTTWGVAEFVKNSKSNKEYNSNYPVITGLIPKAQSVFSYLIVMGGGPYVLEKHSLYTENEEEIHKIDGIYLPYNTDAVTAGSKRLIELINRIMGYDLKDELFPDYSREDLKRMAWHINRENFNTFGPRPGSIPKYGFGEDGRPVFDTRLK